MSKSIFTIFCALFISHWANAFESVDVLDKSPSDLHVVVFLSQSCPCSQSHVDHLAQLKELYPNISFYGVIADVFDKKSEGDILSYFEPKRFSFPIIKDEEQVLVNRFRALKTPHAVLYKKLKGESEIEILYEGGVTDGKDFSDSAKKYLGENLALLAEGKPLKYRYGKSLGCYIRRL